MLSTTMHNAVKYSGTRTLTMINVEAQITPQSHLIRVGDSGVGFDPQHQDRLFGIFQRLHHADDFERTGIGLATVQRIVQRHGGEIWATSTLDQGATFTFNLPRLEAGAAQSGAGEPGS